MPGGGKKGEVFMGKNVDIRDDSVRFAQEFLEELESGQYEKEHLPNQGVPMNEGYAKERLQIFNAILDADLLGGNA